MKKKAGTLLVLMIMITLFSLFQPAVKIYVHSQAGEGAGIFPDTISLMNIVTKEAAGLPVETIPALGLMNTGRWILMAGMLFLMIGVVLALGRKKGWIQAALVTTCMALGLLATFMVQLMNLSKSLLFELLLDEIQVWAYVPIVTAVLQILFVLLIMKDCNKLEIGDRVWRKLGGILAIGAIFCVLLPTFLIKVPDSVTGIASDAEAMNRSVSILQQMLGNEPSLSEIAAEEGVFRDVLNGDLAELGPYYQDKANVRGIFQVSPSVPSVDLILAGSLVLLVIGAILAFISKADKWFPLAFFTLATILFAASIMNLVIIDDGDMYASAVRQLEYLGLGTVSAVPVVMLLLCLGSTVCSVMSVRTADSPYFVSPIPQKKMLCLVAVLLAVLSLVMVLLPGVEFSFNRPGKSKTVSAVMVSGVQALGFQKSKDVLQPKDSKGNVMYKSSGGGDTELSAAAVEDIMSGLLTEYSIFTWIVVVLICGGILALLKNMDTKIPVTLFVMAFAMRVVTWGILSLQMNRSIGSATAGIGLYISLPLLIFAAFIANFAYEEMLPRKYKLFLLLVPFLVATFLFSYLPLYGWRYALYNYKFGLPMSDQEFVGFKWFTELFRNGGHRTNIIRVLKNTLGMSGLGLLTSWMPMAFAIFLNEVKKEKFKKVVQIATTLPNFISWPLVFSFALAMFSMDTGIFSKFMLSIGAIDEPVAWLNSGNHIWLKMWAWGTWKGLGWGAIMYLAAITGIDQEQYEAAKVDGANRWQQMRHITLPGLIPTFFVLLLLNISNILNNGMDQYLVFQNPMNKNFIEVLDLHVYNITIAAKGTSSLYSLGTAVGILKTLVSIILLFSANKFSRKVRGESIM